MIGGEEVVPTTTEGCGTGTRETCAQNDDNACCTWRSKNNNKRVF
jgi:hypothetical protein